MKKLFSLALITTMLVCLFPIPVNASSGYIWPVPESDAVSQSYKYNSQTKSGHKGIDISGYGLEVKAVKSGYVFAKLEGCVNTGNKTKCTSACSPSFNTHDGYCNNGAGIGLYIDHGDGTLSVYAHMSSIDSKVKAGERVSQGQALGYTGNTGNTASGKGHLHFELRTGSTSANYSTPNDLYNNKTEPVNPQDYIKPTDHVHTYSSENKCTICGEDGPAVVLPNEPNHEEMITQNDSQEQSYQGQYGGQYFDGYQPGSGVPYDGQNAGESANDTIISILPETDPIAESQPQVEIPIPIYRYTRYAYKKNGKSMSTYSESYALRNGGQKEVETFDYQLTPTKDYDGYQGYRDRDNKLWFFEEIIYE